MKTLVFAFSILWGTALLAQDSIRLNKKDGGFKFTLLNEHKATAVKNQHKSGTCWSYSTLSFFESELMRMGKGEHDLSEMFIVRNTYKGKAEQYVRMHGHVNFAAGGAFHDVVNVIRKYGILPQEAYPGNPEFQDKPVHNEMDAVLSAFVAAVVKNPNGKLTDKWKRAFDAVLDVYLGPVAASFLYQGKSYSPSSYRDALGINPDDYIEISSFSHHPFYKPFALEVPDNWSWDLVYNVPLEDLGKITDHALQNGYTVAWASDISEKYFSYGNGVAYVPVKEYDEMSKEEKESMFNTAPDAERKITQELRQQGFDNYTTEDDHGMHITGMAKDQKGNLYYVVKNSWGTDRNECGGYLYASRNFMLYKTTCIMVHKKALPKDIAKKLGL
ncbi:MAG: C1 family peptidase [Cytophagaceae bacterium]|jgi:bleomycin hydrolase|nr:C1 family peptidase [Cytophagaceae bacterium]